MRFGQRPTQGKDHLKTKGKDGHLQSKERGLRENQPCQHLDLSLLASRTVGKLTSMFKPPNPGYFVMAPKLRQVLSLVETTHIPPLASCQLCVLHLNSFILMLNLCPDLRTYYDPGHTLRTNHCRQIQEVQAHFLKEGIKKRSGNGV